ncbi:MBL fold metallo-hydrolase [Actinokineospora iranica]|uniref:Glyoxylase, beta-lactamase superfamily II n=1 Tax=Actinokineospora iranica TaxID=1271860 RepID=A0A1G6WZ40_9PSEU|nr:MBL fold metallo-hydrolase [Actinokineospora iranica]SDD71230.1 Glyoxylase, beta-lactamase superfamily II [Actinokineospora iranica]
MGAGSGPWTEPGAFEVAPGVHRIPLPLPNDGLHAVNVYAIETGGGVVLVDSGWGLREARDLLESSLGAVGYELGDVQRFLVTHMHRDHYTMAVELRRMFGTKIALGLGEQPNIEAAIAGETESQFRALVQWGADTLVDPLRALYDARDPGRPRYETPDEWIPGAQDIQVGDRVLRAVPTPGHTRGHVVFVDEAARLLFAGDHVLPHITPSIGFEPARAELPLGDYLDSLRLMRTFPDLRLLPAHGPVADSVHTRVDELLAHHEDRLAETAAAVRDGAGTAFAVARLLGWTRRARHFDTLDLFNQVLAVGETAAHLDVLVARCDLKSSTADGVVEYLPMPHTTGPS